MNTLFVLNSSGNTIISSEAKALFPQLKKVSLKQLRYIILAYDTFNSLFKHYPYEQWAELACDYVYNHKEVKQVEKGLEKTIEWFKNLQNLDQNRLNKIRFENRKQQLMDKLLSVENPTDLKNIRLAIEQIEEVIKTFDKEIEKEDDNVLLAKKGAELTVIEIWQRKQKRIS